MPKNIIQPKASAHDGPKIWDSFNGGAKCVHCDEYISPDATRCPYCEDYKGEGWKKSEYSKKTLSWARWSFWANVLLMGGLVYYAKLEHDLNVKIDAGTNRTEKVFEAQQMEAASQTSARPVSLPAETLTLVQDSKILQGAISAAAKISPEGSDIEVFLKNAFVLKSQGIKYRWNGKALSQGFDSSGFVAYLLATVHRIAVEDIPIMWSGELRNRIKPIENNELRVGDLLFYPGGLVMIYLGQNGRFAQSIGMSNQHNIFIMKTDGYANVQGYGRWTDLPIIKSQF